MVRHRNEIRKCTMSDEEAKAINPLNIYNDETHTLAYSIYGLLRSGRERRDASGALLAMSAGAQAVALNASSPPTPSEQRLSSIFDSDYIKTKEVVEPSGARVRTVDIVSVFVRRARARNLLSSRCLELQRQIGDLRAARLPL